MIILKREALCRQLPLRFWRLEGGQNERFLKVRSGFKEGLSGLKAALVGLIVCRAGLKAFVEAAGESAGGGGFSVGPPQQSEALTSVERGRKIRCGVPLNSQKRLRALRRGARFTVGPPSTVRSAYER